MNFPSIHIEGGLIPADVLDAIAAGEMQGQAPTDFHLPRTARLTDEIAAAWADARAYWAAFQRRLLRLEDDDPATTDTRQQWIIPLLESLGYEQVTYFPTAAIVDGRSYAISHRDGEDESALPIHVQGCRVPLDQRPPSGRPRLSAHALVQEYLNHTEHLWGIVTNGYRLRLVRNSALMSRQSYVEFDLHTMLEGEHFADFGVMFRLLHRTRLPLTMDDGARCWLERYYQEGVEQGGRVRDRLRDGVEDALRILGNGFLSHPRSTALRERVAAGDLSALAYYRQLLRLIYRFLFLLVAEERGLIGPTDPALAALFTETYSLSRLRPLVEARLTASERYHDLWLGLARTTFMLHQEQEHAAKLGMSALDGDLFGPRAIEDLSAATITNRDLLAALRRLMLWRDDGVTRRVNYAALDVEELGSVYESLLDYHPVLSQNGSAPRFDLVFGTERKSTGSYYTRPELVQELIKSALEPVMERVIKEAAARAPAPIPGPSPSGGREQRKPRNDRGAFPPPQGEVWEGAAPPPEGEDKEGAEDAEQFRVMASRAMVKIARELRQKQTPAEKTLWEALRKNRLGDLRFRRQHPVANTRYVVDFFCYSANLIVELDGDIHHAQRADDARRQAELERQGYHVLRFPNERIHTDLENVLIEILAVAHSAPIPGPSPSGGREQPESQQGRGAFPPHEGEDKEGARAVDPREHALLGMNICDPAAGSGHFLLAAARRLGLELARIRTGEPHPGPEHTRPATRDVIRHCIYGVDKNPLAVDLCKVALWLEGHNRDKPLTFLDHHIKHGDSLVGVFDLTVLKDGIPDGAYNPVTGDDKAVARGLKKQNKEESGGQLSLFGPQVVLETDKLAAWWQAIEDTPDDTVDAVRQKQASYEQARRRQLWQTLQTASHLWTAAFFLPKTKANAEWIPTTDTVRRYVNNPGAAHGFQVGLAYEAAAQGDYFHWPLEFPDVFARGGFDVVLGNPPWERIKLQEKEFFATRDTQIASAPNAAARGRLIKALPQHHPALAAEFEEALRHSAATANFLRESERFPLTSRGDINTYSVFAGLARNMISPQGRAGIIVPTGIATDDTNKFYFADLVENGRLASLYDFENREAIFSGVHRSYKFSMLTLQGKDSRARAAEFVFYATNTGQLDDPQRRFQLSAADFARINPNTRTCPIFRTRADADLTRKIYERVPVLINEETGANPWGISFQRMLDMSNDSGLFRTREELEAQGYTLKGNRFVGSGEWGVGSGSRLPTAHSPFPTSYLPLYEAKLLHQFDHRWATYESPSPSGRGAGGEGVRDLTLDEKTDPGALPLPRYWVSEAEVLAKVVTLEGDDQRRIDALPPEERLAALREIAPGWLLGFRGIARSTDERSAIFGLLPLVGAGNSAPILVNNAPAIQNSCLAANCSSLVFDFVTRQKVGGANFNFFIVKQLPVLPPDAYSPGDIDFIAPRVLRLVYTAWDMQPFAQDLWREWGAGSGQSGAGSGQSGAGSGQSRAAPHSPFPAAREAIIRAWEMNHGRSIHTVLPGLASLAGSDDAGRADLSPDTGFPPSGALRDDQPDAARGSVRPGQHRGGVRSREPGGLHSLSSDRTGITQGTGDSSAAGRAGKPDDGELRRALLDAMRSNWQDAARLDSLVAALITSPHSPLPIPPFRWDEDERAQLRAELDAYYAHLYGLSRDELRYILDPADVYGEEFPGETFRVLKEKEIRQYGEYRTRRLVLAAWDKLGF